MTRADSAVIKPTEMGGLARPAGGVLSDRVRSKRKLLIMPGELFGKHAGLQPLLTAVSPENMVSLTLMSRQART